MALHLLAALQTCEGFIAGPVSHVTLRGVQRTQIISAKDGDSTNWDDAMEKLRQRQAKAGAAGMDADADSGGAADVQPTAEPLLPLRTPPPETPPPPAASAAGWLAADNAAPPPASSGFRYEKNEPPKQEDFVAGLDKNDEALLRTAYLYGGRALTLITLSSLAFYIWVGVSGATRGRIEQPRQTAPSSCAGQSFLTDALLDSRAPARRNHRRL